MKKKYISLLLCTSLPIQIKSMELFPEKMDALDVGRRDNTRVTIDRLLAESSFDHVFFLDYSMLSCQLSIQDCGDFANKIRKMPPLEKIICHSLCQLDRDGIKRLFGAFNAHGTVQELDLSFNPAFSVDDGRCLILTSLLKTMRQVQTFKFQASDLALASNIGLRALVPAWGQMQLKTLDLSFNQLNLMNDRGNFSLLMETVGSLEQLRVLRLAHTGLNLMDAYQWYAWCSMVSAVPIKVLDISSNDIGLLKENLCRIIFIKTLSMLLIEELNVSDNWLDASSDEFWNDFTCAIPRMKKLKRLDMRGNGLSSMPDDRRLKLVRALIQCPGCPVLVLKIQDDFNKYWTRLAEQENRLKIVFEE